MLKGHIIDISPTVDENSPVFPGDRPYKRQVMLDWPKNHISLSSIEATLHIGAHADAPYHYDANGCGIDQVPLERYMGPCQVVDARSFGPVPIPAEVLQNLEIATPRVLFRTDSFDHGKPFQNQFASLSPDLLDFLKMKRVFLVGIDTPSVDPADSKDLPAHKALFRNDISVLESLILSQVDVGKYELIALPLKLRSAEASPVRAVLRV